MSALLDEPIYISSTMQAQNTCRLESTTGPCVETQPSCDSQINSVPCELDVHPTCNSQTTSAHRVMVDQPAFELGNPQK